MKASISFLSSKFTTLETLIKIDSTDASYVHVDIMDGKFTDSVFDPIEELKHTVLSKKLDVHLMTLDVLNWIEKLNNLNISYITFHSEIKENKKKIIEYIKSKSYENLQITSKSQKIKVGMAINPETKVSSIKQYLKDLDLVLVLGVNPGKGGQEFILNTIDKIEELKNLKKEFGYKYKIEVDGGINDENAKLVEKAGCDIIVCGSFVCKRNNFQEQINLLK